MIRMSEENRFFVKQEVCYMRLLVDSFNYLLPGCIVSICYLIIYEMIIKMKKERVTWWYRILLLSFGIYLTIILSSTISPVYGFSLGVPDFQNINLKPFKVLDTLSSNPINFFGNIIMFIPYGSFLVLLGKKFRKVHITVFSGIKLSLFLEIVQLFEDRGTDIDDLILNGFGTLCGYIIGILVISVFPAIFLNIRPVMRESGKLVRKDINHNYFIIIIVISVFLIGFKEIKTFEDRIDNMQKTDFSSPKAIELEPAPKKNIANLDVNVNAPNVYLFDVENEVVLYEKESNAKIAPASTTKMLTAITVLDYCELNEEAEVGQEIYLIANDASKAWLSVGDKLTIKQLLDALLLPSGNDAAYSLAVYTGRKISGDYNLSIQDSINLFISTMNKKAVSIGATHSNFSCPDGYDANGQYTTAYDLSRIGEEFIGNSTLKEIASSIRISDKWPNGKEITYKNTNELINPESPYYYKNVIGLKTGSSGNAGDCLVSAANINNKLYICVLMGSTSKEDKWLDSIKLYNSIH